MDPFTTPGAFSWAELSTPDPAAAADFYGALFGWATQSMDMGGPTPYRVVSVGQQGVAGIMGPPPSAPNLPATWGVYITVADCDAAVSRCTELGGRCMVPPMDVPGVGRMAVLQDPQGAVFSVMAYSAPA